MFAFRLSENGAEVRSKRTSGGDLHCMPWALLLLEAITELAKFFQNSSHAHSDSVQPFVLCNRPFRHGFMFPGRPMICQLQHSPSLELGLCSAGWRTYAENHRLPQETLSQEIADYHLYPQAVRPQCFEEWIRASEQTQPP